MIPSRRVVHSFVSQWDIKWEYIRYVNLICSARYDCHTITLNFRRRSTTVGIPGPRLMSFGEEIITHNEVYEAEQARNTFTKSESIQSSAHWLQHGLWRREFRMEHEQTVCHPN